MKHDAYAARGTATLTHCFRCHWVSSDLDVTRVQRVGDEPDMPPGAIQVYAHCGTCRGIDESILPLATRIRLRLARWLSPRDVR